MTERIIVTTGNDCPGYAISAYLGVVRGIVVRAQTIEQGCPRNSLRSSATTSPPMRRSARRLAPMPFRVYPVTPPPGPLPEAERGREEENPVVLPLPEAERGPGGGVTGQTLRAASVLRRRSLLHE